MYTREQWEVLESQGDLSEFIEVIQMAAWRGLTVRQDLDRHLNKLFEIWVNPNHFDNDWEYVICEYLPKLLATAERLQKLKML